jgi:hypothetical protein
MMEQKQKQQLREGEGARISHMRREAMEGE